MRFLVTGGAGFIGSNLALELERLGLGTVVVLDDFSSGAFENLRGFKSLRVQGLMVLPPFGDAPESGRPYFRRLRELRDRAAREGLLRGSELSMGMSHDFEVAIEEGATLVRVGTAIFGERARKG